MAAPSVSEKTLKLCPVVELIEEFWTWRLRESPEFATRTGDNKYDNLLDNHSLDSFHERVKFCEGFIKKLKKIANSLGNDDSDSLSLHLLELDVDLYIQGMQFKGYLLPINSLEGPQTDFETTMSYMKFNTIEDYDKYLSRIQALPTLVDQFIELMRAGIKEGRTSHQVSMDGVAEQFDSITNAEPTDLVFYKPFHSIPDHIPKGEQNQLKERAHDLIQNCLQTSFSKLRLFISEEYSKSLRQDIACSSLPNGKDYYLSALKFHTTCDLSPQEVHDLGLKEVSRIRTEMEKVKKEVNFQGTLKEFFKKVRTSPEFYHKSKADLLKDYRSISADKIKPQLPNFFKDIPQVELKIEPLPVAREANAPGAFYEGATMDGSKPGVFYVNCFNLNNHPTTEMIALSLHEAEPGHHLQHCYSIQQKNLPVFRRIFEDYRYYEAPSKFQMYTAYMEGWGLYCEYLGEEMGLYEDPYSLFGHYSLEIFRACRLVVDPGMHYLGWTKQQAVAYMEENTPFPLQGIEVEVNRYITWPAQACAYKIGELKIRELRAKAVSELGDKFDVRDFHSAILTCGAVPLNILEDIVHQYIETQQRV